MGLQGTRVPAPEYGCSWTLLEGLQYTELGVPTASSPAELPA